MEDIIIILLVASNKDAASQNIARQVLSHYSFEKLNGFFQENPIFEARLLGKTIRLVTLKEESVYAQSLPSFFTDLELVVFVSRHSSESGTPTLSVHAPGNLGQAELGGISRKVSVCAANAMRDALRTLDQSKEAMHLEYDVSYECTHHGPSLDLPTIFVELGSSMKQWNDLHAAEAVAHAAMSATSKFGSFPSKAVLGVGGTHYNGKFTRMALQTDLAFSHMIPKYAIPYVDSNIIKQCVERSLEKVEYAILDWKGIKGENKTPLVKMLEEMDLHFEKV